MGEHTKGPWEVSGVAVLTSDNPISQVAICHIYGPKDSGPPVAEGNANARLIAAAPDLLEALEEVEEELRLRTEMRAAEQRRGPIGIAAGSDSDARYWQARNKKVEAIVARRRTAIARARGEG